MQDDRAGNMDPLHPKSELIVRLYMCAGCNDIISDFGTTQIHWPYDLGTIKHYTPFHRDGVGADRLAAFDDCHKTMAVQGAADAYFA
jgi:hypothetical protein